MSKASRTSFCSTPSSVRYSALPVLSFRLVAVIVPPIRAGVGNRLASTVCEDVGLRRRLSGNGIDTSLSEVSRMPNMI